MIKSMLLIVAMYCTACSIAETEPRPKPQPIQISDDTVVNSAMAMDRYAKGLDSLDNETARRFFRAECSYHQLDRELTIDMMHERAGIHLYAWKDFYQRHCKLVPGTMVIPETGKEVEPYICDADAGAPPGRAYERSDEEKLAQKQRDACERAQ
jgi:hypothetical protein